MCFRSVLDWLSRELTPQIEETISILQSVVAATTVRENGYVKLKDWDYFVDLISLSITSKKLEELDSKSFFELAAAFDPNIAAQKWASMMLPLVAGTEHNQKLEEVLSQWAAGLVVMSKIKTCEACFDRKGADKVRIEHRVRSCSIFFSSPGDAVVRP